MESFGTTQSTPSAQQGGYGVMGNCHQVFDHGYRVAAGGNYVAGEYKKYQGAVYAPFNDTPPSESGEAAGVTGRKNAFPGRPDTPPAPGSPVAEPLVLLFFAAVAAIFIAKRKKEPTPALPQGKE